MLPYIIGAVVVGVGAYLLDDAKSENRSARRRYDDAYDDSYSRVDRSYRDAQKKDTLDKLFKIKRSKQEVADAIYGQLRDRRDNFAKVNGQLKSSKEVLSALFSEKKSLSTRDEKREVQNRINVVMDARKELFGIKDGLKSDIVELTSRLKDANQETRDIQSSINSVLEE